MRSILGAARLRKPLAENLRTFSLDYVLLKDYPDSEHWIKSSLTLVPNGCAEAWGISWGVLNAEPSIGSRILSPLSSAP